jgi:hypothetical protein
MNKHVLVVVTGLALAWGLGVPASAEAAVAKKSSGWHTHPPSAQPAHTSKAKTHAWHTKHRHDAHAARTPTTPDHHHVAAHARPPAAKKKAKK